VPRPQYKSGPVREEFLLKLHEISVSVAEDDIKLIPPPIPDAVHPETVEKLIVTVPPSMYNPPPPDAVHPETVEELIVTVPPSMYNPPPPLEFAVHPETVEELIVTDAPP